MTAGGTHDHLLIREYLLGGLTEPERDRMDEMSIADDDFAVALRIAEDELVDSYVHGELHGETLERFKTSYLNSPANLEKVSFARALGHACDRSAARFTTCPVALPVKPSPRGRPGWIGAWQWAAATTVLILLPAAGWLLVQKQSLRRALETVTANQVAAPDRAAQRTPVIVAFTLAPQVRGISSPPEIAVPDGAEYLTLQLPLESNEHDTYAAELKALPARNVVFGSGRLRSYGPAASPTVAVSLSVDLLQPQLYFLELNGLNAGGDAVPVASYTFRIVR